jgi:hypothetical protein
MKVVKDYLKARAEIRLNGLHVKNSTEIFDSSLHKIKRYRAKPPRQLNYIQEHKTKHKHFLCFNCCFTVHLDKFKAFCQQMLSLLKHKMLQLTLKISLYMAPTRFGPLGPSSGSIRRNLAKITVFVEIISKNTSLKLLLCSGNMCFIL